jgi:glycosyltransferase involved in cell wall biosynthesis
MKNKNHLKIVFVSHNVRFGGGISVSINYISEFIIQNPNYKYLLFFPSNCGYEQNFSKTNNIEIKYFRYGNNFTKRLIFDLITVPILINKFKPTFVFSLGNFSVNFIKFPQFILLHNPFLCGSNTNYKDKISNISKIYFFIQRKVFKKSLKNIELLFCQTLTMKNNVLETYPFYTKSIKLLPNVISIKIRNHIFNSEISSLILKDNKKLLFCLSAYYPHKNLEIIIDLLRKYRIELMDYKFIITIDSINNKKAKKIITDINKYSLQDQIINLGPVKQENLNTIYTNSYALFLPSLLESFTGTYIEAMSYNLPILTSNYNFAREVCGDAAVYFDPLDLKSIKNTILCLNTTYDSIKSSSKLKYTELEKQWSNVVRNSHNEIKMCLDL